MSKIKVSYFDVDGGRGEPIRIVLHAAGIPFEDFRFGYGEFAEVRKTTPLNQVPTVNIDGVQYTQSCALLRYFGKAADLYPQDAFQALLCDEIIDGSEDLTNKLVASFGLQGDALKSAREAFIAGPLTQYLGWMAAKLAAQGNYFANGKLTIGDLKVFMLLRWLSSGMLDHIPADCVSRIAPSLAAYAARIAAEPVLTSYYESRAGK
ncbi:glutathione S-transferase family protein [Shewanella sp. JM162201]|uniref:Glutathione S-transferase family protein n=1 Tax=Shewanella jiangmenensis TaxID=2837387 RepID=A0ABS5V0L5_9GAMM|nr:glutathione S-transferase family protein [Shewanella jiangmenensis]MBT1444021.1 glutathione S-transferase family protein [Shewanella jiangmenensis]